MSAELRRLDAPVYVSKPLLPPLERYSELLASVWDSAILTNSGALHERLEAAISQRIGFGHASLWNNGTSALVGALQILDLRGEVVVTPFTFPATVHAIASLGLTPVFADIDPVTMTIDPAGIQERLSPRTTAIVGTHIYGISCDTAAIARLASPRGLRVVYDGAHSFGRPSPVFPDTPDALGDATMLSFHATKLFHTGEGGAVVTRDPELHRRLRLARNFGIRSETESEGVGLNGKLSELHAAMGLLLLDLLDEEFERRAAIAELYRARLEGVPGLAICAGLAASKQYFVIRVSEGFGASRDQLHAALREVNVFSRRYFFPLVSDLDPFSELPSAAQLPNARLAADEVLVLPLYGSLSPDVVELVCDVVDAVHAGRPVT